MLGLNNSAGWALLALLPLTPLSCANDAASDARSSADSGAPNDNQSPSAALEPSNGSTAPEARPAQEASSPTGDTSEEQATDPTPAPIESSSEAEDPTGVQPPSEAVETDASPTSAPAASNPVTVAPDPSSRGDAGAESTDESAGNSDAGPSSDAGSRPENAEAEAPPGVPGIIAVGYGGLRITSRDQGLTWEHETHWSENGGDDRDLLRTIAYGNGTWVSGGWRITTSTDGVEWTDRGDSADVISAVNCQVTDGMAFGGGQFLVACGSSLAASDDGLEWHSVGPTPPVGGHPHIIFDPALDRLACSGDNGDSFTSADGSSWDALALDSVRLCDGFVAESECPGFYTDGIYLSTEWGGLIRRSETGRDWDTTYRDQNGNNLFTSYSFSAGRVAPKD